MKKVLAMVAIMSLASCTSTQKAVSQTNWLGKKVSVISKTPENGTVTAERKHNTTMSLEATSGLHPVMMYSEDKMVISFEYNKKTSDAPHRDDFYKEEILMEIPLKAFKRKYNNQELQDVKLLFGKHCYCKGQAGYYKISEGTLKIKHTEKETFVSLTFQAPVSSQLGTVEFVVE